MPEILGQDCVDAWRRGVECILSSKGEASNILIRIENPSQFSADWLNLYNPITIRPESDDINDVINTIFPYRIRNKNPDRKVFYERYLLLLQRARRAGRQAQWGTYFERLINFGRSDLNQLEIIIQKLRSWDRRSKSGLVIHTSSPHLDRPRTRGGPCWQYGQIYWREGDVLDFTVVYRNHDYFNKALGNFIALSKLLQFICAESGKSPGSITCHSIHAYCGASVSCSRSLIEAQGTRS